MRSLRLCLCEASWGFAHVPGSLDVWKCCGFAVGAAMFAPISHETTRSVQKACGLMYSVREGRWCGTLCAHSMFVVHRWVWGVPRACCLK